jgi:hypothetical protein
VVVVLDPSTDCASAHDGWGETSTHTDAEPPFVLADTGQDAASGAPAAVAGPVAWEQPSVGPPGAPGSVGAGAGRPPPPGRVGGDGTPPPGSGSGTGGVAGGDGTVGAGAGSVTGRVGRAAGAGGRSVGAEAPAPAAALAVTTRATVAPAAKLPTKRTMATRFIKAPGIG